MATYKTPDVYVEEISLFPPSVAEVATAIPAFIGYTEKAEKNGEDLTMKPTVIRSLVEFERYYGKGPPIEPTVKLDDLNAVSEVDLGGKRFYLYDSLRLYFDNGGGRCYIVSVGDYDGAPALGTDTTEVQGGLKALEKEDEPTIIVAPDATLFSSTTHLYDFQQKALDQCAKLQDRVAVCDLKHSGDMNADVNEFRNNIGIKSLKYGAAYLPWLKTSYTKTAKFRNISLKRASSDAAISLENLTKDQGLKDYIAQELKAAVDATNRIKSDVIDANLSGDNKTLKEQLDSLVDGFNAGKPYADEDAMQDELRDLFTLLLDILHATVDGVRDATTDTNDFKLKQDLDTIVNNNQLDDAFQTLIRHHNASIGFTTGKIFETTGAPQTRLSETIAALNTITGSTLADDQTDAGVDAQYGAAADADAKGDLARDAALAAFSSIHAAVSELLITAVAYEDTFDSGLVERFALYKTILNQINEKANELPPGGAIAGVYAFTDRTRGVWKAPANVSLTSVVGPTVKIDAKEQEDLNVDVNAGKSINAIRAFSGKGTLVWGARTLAGNDNEWRYISVRRFYNMVEESVKKSTYWAVFEPNDANTWIKVKSMIENYLVQKWRDGALAGAKPEQAFFVKVGLGETMTAQDILEGRMIVEIGMAVVRPAEFIILRFSHKMQES